MIKVQDFLKGAAFAKILGALVFKNGCCRISIILILVSGFFYRIDLSRFKASLLKLSGYLILAFNLIRLKIP